MSSFNTIPDLISSSVNVDKAVTSHHDEGRHSISGPQHTRQKKKYLVNTIISEFTNVIKHEEAKKIMGFILFNFIGTVMLLFWCSTTNSMALTAFTYLTVFDIFSLLSCLLSIWVKRQKPTPAFSFGYERFEVLAVFSCTMLAQLGSFFILKESVERMFEQPDIHTGRLLLGSFFGYVVHMTVTYGVENEAMNHVIAASSSSWLQEHMTDMSESVCHLVPGLSRLLLPRINPFALIASATGLLLFITYLLIDTKNYFAADTFTAVCIAVMIFGTMFPMSVYTGKILLQTTPAHMLGQLDKVLREASTLDGVLEFRQEHFWTLSFGNLCGSVQVRVRRDADEQLVLAHVHNRLSSLVTTLTIQIFKDDWTRASTYSFGGSTAFSNPSMISQSKLMLPQASETPGGGFPMPSSITSSSMAASTTGSRLDNMFPGTSGIGMSSYPYGSSTKSSSRAWSPVNR